MENPFGIEPTDERWAPITTDIVTPALDDWRYRLHQTIAAPVAPQKRSDVHRSLCYGAKVSATPRLSEKVSEVCKKHLKRILGDKSIVKPMWAVIAEDIDRQADLFYKEYCEVAGFFLCKDLISNWETLEILPPSDEMSKEIRDNFEKYQERLQALAKLLKEGNKRREEALKKKEADKLAGIPEPEDSEDEEKKMIILYVYKDETESEEEEEEDSSAPSTSNAALTRQIRALRRQLRRASIRQVNGGIPPEIFNHPKAKHDERRYTKRELSQRYRLALNSIGDDDSSDEEEDEKRHWRVVAVPYEPNDEDDF